MGLAPHTRAQRQGLDDAKRLLAEFCAQIGVEAGEHLGVDNPRGRELASYLRAVLNQTLHSYSVVAQRSPRDVLDELFKIVLNDADWLAFLESRRASPAE